MSYTSLTCPHCFRVYKVERYEPGVRYTCDHDGAALQPTQSDLPVPTVPQSLRSTTSSPRIRVADIRTPKRESSDPLIGKQFGAFKIKQLLARGGMASVYLALAEEKRYAIKFLAETPEDPTACKRFVREGQIATQIKHPNLVRVWEVGHHEEFYYLIMDYVEGESLGDRLRDKGAMTPLQVLPPVIAAVRGLQAVHAANVLHRDFKPDNLLIDKRGHVKLADLGLARLLDPGVSRLTAHNKRVGTPYFMAPEQAIDPDGEDFRADVYSVGVTLYHALSLQFPYSGTTPFDVMKELVGGQPVHISRYAPLLPEQVIHTVSRLIHRDRKRRPRDCAELLDVLQHTQRALEADDGWV